MASIRREIKVAVAAERVWDAVRDFGAVHERLAPGVLTDSRLDGPDARVVTFAHGPVVREVLVDVDDDARRLVYSVVDAPLGFSHHQASIEVVVDDDACTLIWVSDLLPNELAGPVGDLMDQGAAAMIQTLSSLTSRR